MLIIVYEFEKDYLPKNIFVDARDSLINLWPYAAPRTTPNVKEWVTLGIVQPLAFSVNRFCFVLSLIKFVSCDIEHLIIFFSLQWKAFIRLEHSKFWSFDCNCLQKSEDIIASLDLMLCYFSAKSITTLHPIHRLQDFMDWSLLDR